MSAWTSTLALLPAVWIVCSVIMMLDTRGKLRACVNPNLWERRTSGDKADVYSGSSIIDTVEDDNGEITPLACLDLVRAVLGRGERGGRGCGNKEKELRGSHDEVEALEGGKLSILIGFVV